MMKGHSEEHPGTDEVKEVDGDDPYERGNKHTAGNVMGLQQPNMNSFSQPAQSKCDIVLTPVIK